MESNAPPHPVRSPRRRLCDAARFGVRAALRLALGSLLLALAAPAPADSRFLVVCGAGGEKEYSDRFLEWGGRLRDALVAMGRPKDSIRLLTERGEGAARSDLSGIEKALDSLAKEATEKDDVFVFLIGHASHLRRESRFHVPGPDPTGEWFAERLARVKARRVAVVVAAGGGAGFVNALGAPGRIVCSATRDVREIQATEFAEFLVRALEEGSADQNRDGRVSLLEACAQAASLVAAWYTAEGFIQSEHAILDDDGDGLGTRLLDLEGSGFGARAGADAADAGGDSPGAGRGTRVDGALAARTFLRDFVFPPSVPRELVDRYLALLEEAEALLARKAAMKSEEFETAFERKMLEVARANREIRSREGQVAP